MASKHVLKDKLVVYILSALLVVMASFAVFTILSSYFTLGEPTVSKWDGVSVSSSFSSGNGTLENPYIINDGADLAYFKSLIEGLNSTTYSSAHYRLGNNIDMGDNEFSAIGIIKEDEERFFKGTLDGNGYTIRNVKIVGQTIKEYDVYGLFTIVSGGNVSNVNLENFDIYPSQTSNPLIVGTIAGEVRSLSTIKNVSIYDGDINLSTTQENTNSKIGSVVGSVATDVKVSNIYINTKLSSEYSIGVAKVSHTIESNLSNIVIDIDASSLMVEGVKNFATSSNGSTINNLYIASYDNGSLIIKKDDNNISVDKMTTILDEELTGDFYWSEENGVLKLSKVKVHEENMPPVNFAFGESVLVEHASGVVGDTVHINDLESDYNQYRGLNYTDFRKTGTLPTGVNQNLYTTANLAKVFIKYSGTSFNDPNMIGYVSLTEQQSNLIYYKYLPVVDGYVTFELIDNPYGDRPNDKAFNGWVTGYPGAVISINTDTYVRSVKVPVSNITGTTSIEFYSNWIDGKTTTITNANQWNSVYNSLDSAGLVPIGMGDPIYESVDKYFVYGGKVNRFGTYPNNAFNSSGNNASGLCWDKGGCIYYLRPASSVFDPNITYYHVGSTSTMETIIPEIIDYTVGPDALEKGTPVVGYFIRKKVYQTGLLDGLYDQSGNLVSGVCNDVAGCSYYEYIQYYDATGNVSMATGNDVYFYLATRDTNIVILQGNINGSLDNNVKPFTLTSINNGNDYSSSATYNIRNNYISLGQDLRIEHISLTSNRAASNSNPANSAGSSGYIYANWKNLKIGRGIKNTGTNTTAYGVIAGNSESTGSSNNLTRYQIIVESGFYDSLSATNGTRGLLSGTRDVYIDGEVIYGNDYDRVTRNNNNLQVYFCASGSWGDNVHSDSVQTGVAINTIIKSGSFGTGKSDYSTGVYVGGRQGGTFYSARSTTIEGGWIYNLIGGPLTDSSRRNINDTYINIKGGNIDLVIGGAGVSETYGNRIINMTGGSINYGIFGGSNGYSGDNTSNNNGTLSGSTFIYVGGNAIVGDDNLINDNSNLFGVESGSVFGIGNGNAQSSSIGTADNSHIIIDGSAVIKKNVYGGGNYGTTGINSTGQTNTKINILNGSVLGAVYGGGNNNGSGTTTVSSNVEIEMLGGQVGNIYGGSRTKGIVYGNTSVKVVGGTVNADVYGGGEGGYSNTTDTGTFVTGNSIVEIGRDLNTGSELTLTINGSVYGGSAYGTVNGVDNNSSANTNLSTTVNVYYGTIVKSVFGGGKGNSTFIPRVFAPVTVNIYGGNIGNVYGGNDAAGQPASTDSVYLSGGTIGNAFGGGNSTGQDTTNISLQGASVKNLFGGSNINGVVTTSNVTVTSGTVMNIYGGNNEGTSTTTTNVDVSGGLINGDIYGGGMKAAVTGTANVHVTAPKVNNIYGGGQEADVAATVVNVENTTGDKIFGGSNTDGTVGSSKVTLGGNSLTGPQLVDATVERTSGWGNGSTTCVVYRITLKNNTSNIYNDWTVRLKLLSDYTAASYGIYNNPYYTVANGVVISNVTTWNNPLTANGTYSFDVTVNYNYTYDYNNPISFDVFTVDVAMVSPILPVTSFDSVYGGNNAGGTLENASVIVNNGSINSVYGGGELASTGDAKVLVNNGIINNVFGGGNEAGLTISDVDVLGGTITNVYGGSNNSGTVGTTDIVVGDKNSSVKVTNVYGGNNLGGTTGPTKIVINSGIISDVYGGGNKASAGTTNVVVRNAKVTNIFGGGKAATVNGNTSLDIDYCTLDTNVFGGGDEGAVTGNTEVYVTSSTILGSLYAGGNGTTATVNGNTNVTVDGETTIGSETSKIPYEGCIFGGGNSAFTGTESVGKSTAVVNIVGGHIYGNVYGGANTSVVYGGTVTNIGSNVVSDKTLKQADILIDGTVFGGGEANASGDDKYDFDFNSVVGSIDIYIDGTGYLSNGYKFDMTGSIFGSGNASSSSGTSNISIKKLGTQDNPSKNISIQRTNSLIIDNSYMELIGIEDSTNDFASILYSFNRIDKLIIKNDTTLLLRKNANLLGEIYSGIDVNGNLVPAVVDIDDATKTVTKNVDNRIYTIPYNNLNITTTQDATSYGKVTGMTFFGMYNVDSDGKITYGVYDYNKEYGDVPNGQDLVIGSSYVLGLHHAGHDTELDGFYTNVFNEEMTEIITEYIEPSPPGANFYRWMIGLQTINYDVDLTASKYSSLGTYNLTMLDFPDGDTKFEVIGVNTSGLNKGINLVDPGEVPKIAETEELANSTFGLAMKSETHEWTNVGVTKFLGKDGGTFIGESIYKTDSQEVAPSLLFYLYYPKNIVKEGNVGSVLITLQAEKKINDIESKFEFVTINVNIVAKNYNDINNYDASITYDKKYEMPSATSVNITNRSQFTTYFSLYANGELKKIYGEDYSNYHVLTSSFAFPVGTQITMIDFAYDINKPQYYYFNVDDKIYQDSVIELETKGEVVYRLSDFIKMGSTSLDNTYNDTEANKAYYDGKNMAIEEFVFIFDLKGTTMNGQSLDNSVLLELRNNNDAEVITVLGIRRQIMKFNLYDSTNVVLQEEVTHDGEYLYYNIPNKFKFRSIIGYDQTTNGASIIDTNYESSAMGLNMYVYDSSGNQVSSSLLVGTVLSIDGESAFADGDGVFRIKLSGKVSNLSRNMNLIVDKVLPTGQYKLRFVLFASPDGRHNSSLIDSAVVEIPVTIVGDDNSIRVTTADKTKLVDGDTGLNALESKINTYVLTYKTEFVKPNIRVDLYKRSTTDKDTTVYNEVDFNTLFTNNLNNSLYTSGYLYEKALNANVNSDNTYDFELKDNLVSGTYKLVFRLYDGNQLIEEEIEYIIVTKDVVN